MSNHLFSSIKEEKGEVLHCKNINSPLTKLMGYTEECIEEIDWKPPIKHGLNNSKKIIPTLYFKNKSDIQDIDFSRVIKDDIINYKKLTYNQLEYIKKMSNEEKFELIELYNKVLDVIIQSI